MEPAPHFEALPPPPSMPPAPPQKQPAKQAEKPREKPKAEPPRPAPVSSAPVATHELPAVEKPAEEPAPRTTESRGLGFWMGVVAAFFALAALLFYLFALRPQVRGAVEPPATPESHVAVLDGGNGGLCWKAGGGGAVNSVETEAPSSPSSLLGALRSCSGLSALRRPFH